MSNSFKQKLRDGKPLIGIIQTLASPQVTEILIQVGYDWLFIDMEHTSLNIESVENIMQIGGGKCSMVVRVPGHDEIWSKKVLDIGVENLIFPLVNSADEASEIISLCKYPPEGTRGVGICRAHGYGMKFKEYVSQANDNITIIFQIEHIEGVQNIESIIKVKGIDAILLGPYDLSGSMGKIGELNDGEVQEKIEYVRRVCSRAEIPLGIFTTKVEAVKNFIEKGYTLIAMGMDTLTLAQSTAGILAEIKGKKG